VNEQLRLLIELQKLDTEILSLHSRIDLMPGTLAASEGPLKKAEVSVENIKHGLAALEKKKKDKEQSIDDINEKLKKLKQRSSEIRNNKEYQAHLKEIDRAERDIKAAEGELLDMIESAEKASKQLAAEQASLAEERSRLDIAGKELEKVVAMHRLDLKELKNARKKFIEKLDGDIYKIYIGIMKSGRGLAVVEATNEICGGCNLHIPPQMFLELKRNDEITLCPECRRILYYCDSGAVSPDTAGEGQNAKR